MTLWIMWLAGLAIGALFGFAWGWAAGQRGVVVMVEVEPGGGRESGS